MERNLDGKTTSRITWLGQTGGSEIIRSISPSGGSSLIWLATPRCVYPKRDSLPRDPARPFNGSGKPLEEWDPRRLPTASTLIYGTITLPSSIGEFRWHY